jgi:hypothetical protein
VVAPAVIERGQLKAQTTGGTSMACVLAHVAKTRPASAIVVTDGYVESLDHAAVRKALNGTRLTALVTRNGSPAELLRAGIPYRQLDKLPRRPADASPRPEDERLSASAPSRSRRRC